MEELDTVMVLYVAENSTYLAKRGFGVFPVTRKTYDLDVVSVDT